MSLFNNRYVAYAASQNRTPNQALIQDARDYPGGKMAGFMCWIRDAWRRWAQETGEKKEYGDGWSERQHDAFDQWLGRITP